MTDTERPLDLVARAAADLLPELTERLTRHGLGEIEVADGRIRLRVVASPRAGAPLPEAMVEPLAASAGAGPSPVDPPTGPSASLGVASPAVGFFVYADGLGPGLAVAKGDALGHVEMLGVRHDVRAPRGGTVRNLVAESGEAVEYGQVVVEIEPTVAAPR
jgi:acetyl-CoA carboxylase biotin carboxyl carrier protein